jgi:hypothetical protein
MAVADADVSCEAPPRAADIERVATITLLCGAALIAEDADDVACNAVSVPCAEVDVALPQEPESTKRAAKQVTRERMATGSCVFDVEVLSSDALDTRRAGEALTVPVAGLGDEAEVKLLMTMFGPVPAISLITTSFALYVMVQ